MKIKITFIILLICGVLYSQDKWEQIGPYGGDITSIYTSINGNIFITVAHSGLYRSINNGNSWVKLSQEFISHQMAITESNSGSIYIAAQLGDSWSPSQLMVSSDSGQKWDKIEPTIFDLVYCLFSENNGNILVGNYHSLIRLNETSFKADTLLIADGGIYGIFKINQIIFALTENGLYKSNDNGITWIKKEDMISQLGAKIESSKDNILYAICRGIYKSTDFGNSWTNLNPGFSKDDIVIDSNGDLYAIDVLKIQKMKASNPGVWSDLLLDGLPSEHAWKLGIDKNNNLLVGLSYSGIFKYNSSTYKWEDSNEGITGRTISPIYVTPNGNILAGEYPNHDLFLSADKGITWKRILLSAGYDWVYSFASNSKGEIFMAVKYNCLNYINTECTSLYKSSDNGLTWKSLKFIDGQPGFSNKLFIDSKDAIYYITVSGLWKSIDNGESWQYIYSKNWIRDIFIDKKDYIYLAIESDFSSGHYNPGVVKSEDGGISWIVANEGLMAKNTFKLIGDNKNNLYAFDRSTNEDLCGIYRSNNEGNSWIKVAPKYFVIDFALDSNGFIYAATADSSIIYSTDEGNTWISLWNGYKFGLDFYSLSIDESNNIYAGTISNSIFIIKNFEPTGIENSYDEIPDHFSLSQNYPNPFNPNTTIKYQIAKAGMVQLKIFDLIGREVSTLVNEIQSHGNYKVNFDGKYLSSGVYLYRLISDSFILTKKFILIK
ncbi:MAG: T9SS type A sorting domain-containing protein [Ignavibacteriaceae bacterium]|jgi:photosystem II stability/assembly factor-like uncharacterized protein|nr:T9SS type A sorting domain-containing protein [Ignavibacteriaceae bacterium]